MGRRMALLLLLLALSACGGGGDSTAGSTGREVAVGGDTASGTGGAVGDGAAADGGTGAQPAAADMQKGAANTANGAPARQDFDRRIINTAELGIRVDDVRSSAARARQVVSGLGGSVFSSQLNQGEGYVSADVVLSVPSPRFEAALTALRGLGEEVTNNLVKGEDVTEEFVDLGSRRRNLQAAEASLLRLYGKAQTVADTLAIERELTNIRGQIEQVQGRLQYLEKRTAYSQITLSIQPLAGAAGPRPGWDPVRVISRAWAASLSVLQALATALLSVVVFGWWLAPLLVAGALWFRRRGRVRRPPAASSSQVR